MLAQCDLDICLVLLFQVLNMPSKYANFPNLAPFRSKKKKNYGSSITNKDGNVVKEMHVK